MSTYELVCDILSTKVNFFEIYPKFFLDIVKENNLDIFNKLQTLSLLDDDNNEINNLINIYIIELDKLRKKSDIVSNLVNCRNDLGFFQEMMSDNLNLLRKYTDKQLEVVQYLSLDDALELLNLDKCYIEKINKKYY